MVWNIHSGVNAFDNLSSNPPYGSCNGRLVRTLEGVQRAESMSAAESNPSLLSLSQLWFLSPLRGWHRNPSKAFYQAFQSGSRLRDSKAHSDRYGTILDWAGWACKSVTTCVRCSAATSFAFFLFFFFFCTLSLHVHGLSLKTKLGSQCRIGQ